MTDAELATALVDQHQRVREAKRVLDAACAELERLLTLMHTQRTGSRGEAETR